jgi:hypothetical protein
MQQQQQQAHPGMQPPHYAGMQQQQHVHPGMHPQVHPGMQQQHHQHPGMQSTRGTGGMPQKAYSGMQAQGHMPQHAIMQQQQQQPSVGLQQQAHQSLFQELERFPLGWFLTLFKAFVKFCVFFVRFFDLKNKNK